MSNILTQLSRLAVEAERRNLDGVSFNVQKAMREARCAPARARIAAKGDQIEIESWPDFLNWWNNNRGQNLTYIFIDTYGANSEQVKMVKKLVSSAEKHERDLHQFYMKLRDMASQQLDSEGQAKPDLDVSDDALGSTTVGDDAASSEVDEAEALDQIALGLDEE